MSRNKEPFGRWLIKKLIGAVAIIVIVLILAQIISEVVEHVAQK